jgi:PKD repeat protein
MRPIAKFAATCCAYLVVQAVILTILYLYPRRTPEPESTQDHTVYTPGGFRAVLFDGTPITGNGLPPGLSLSFVSTTGKATISGMPTVAGVYTFTLTATNAGGSTSKDFSLTVNPNPATSFPNVISTPQSLFQAADHSHTTLAADLSSSGTTISVSSGSTFVADEVIRIDNEQIQICAAGSATLTVCSGKRGIAGTTEASHTNTTAVDGRITAIYGNTLNARLIELETWAAAHHLGHYGCPTGPGGFTSGSSWPCHVVTLAELGTDVDGQPLSPTTHNRRGLEWAGFEADIYGTIGSTLGHTGTCSGCPSQPNSSWPNHPVTTTELLVAAPGDSITHDFHNRTVSEDIGLETDIKNNP